MNPCLVCGIPLGYREECPSPECPCVGTRANSVEMEVAAERWRSRGTRALSGDVALDVLERRAYLDYRAAINALEFIHMELP